MKIRRYDLQDRLTDYAARIVKFSDSLPTTKSSWHIRNQILRSGTAPAAHYGEAQGAESRKDFIHKLKIALKELKESRVWLKIIYKAIPLRNLNTINDLLSETEELIAILSKSADTAKSNSIKTK